MANADGVLAAIDSALDDYAVSEDAMRWAPDEPDPTPAYAALPDLSAFFDGFARAAQALSESFSKAVGPVFSAMQTVFHKMGHQGDRRHYRRCPVCNPAGFPKGMSINRSEYTRRRRRRDRR